MKLFSKKKPFYTKDRLQGKSFTIGNFTYGFPTILGYEGTTKLTIGKYCSLADKVTIIMCSEHRLDWTTTYPFPDLQTKWPEANGITGHPCSKGDIIIGNDVWIGYGATILSGVTIGDGVVIGAGSTVSSDIQPYGIAAGNPASTIRTRFDSYTVDRLLKLAWWTWSEEKVHANIHFLCSDDVESFLLAHKC